MENYNFETNSNSDFYKLCRSFLEIALNTYAETNNNKIRLQVKEEFIHKAAEKFIEFIHKEKITDYKIFINVVYDNYKNTATEEEMNNSFDLFIDNRKLYSSFSDFSFREHVGITFNKLNIDLQLKNQLEEIIKSNINEN